MVSYFLIIYIPLIVTFLKKNKLGLKIALLFLILVSGLRYEFGADYVSYYSIFNDIKDNNINVYIQGLEKGYVYLNKIIVFFNLDFMWIFFIITSLNLFLIYKILIYLEVDSKDYWFILFLYLISINYYFYHLSMLRQSVAIYLFIFSLKYLYEKKLYKFILIIMIGVCFHKSAILLLGIYPIVKYLNRKRMIVLLIVGLFVGVNQYLTLNFLNLILNIFELEKYAHYIQLVELNTGLGYTLRVFICVGLIILLGLRNITLKEKIILKLYFLYYFFAFFSIYMGPTYHRFLCYFDWIKILAFYFILKILFKNIKSIKKYKNLIVVVIILFFNILFIKKYQDMIEAYRGTNYLNFISRYKCILFYKDKYKGKRFFREDGTGNVHYY